MFIFLQCLICCDCRGLVSPQGYQCQGRKCVTFVESDVGRGVILYVKDKNDHSLSCGSGSEFTDTFLLALCCSKINEIHVRSLSCQFAAVMHCNID